MPQRSAVLPNRVAILRRLLILFVFHRLVLCSQTTDQNPVQEKGITLSGPLQKVLSAAGHEWRRPLGLIEDSLDTNACLLSPILIKPDDLPGTLDTIVDHCPEYRWEKQSDSFIVLPQRSLKSPLMLHIASITIENATSIDEQRAIMNLPEVKNWMRLNAITLFDLETPKPAGTKEPRFSITLHDVTLLDILNAGAKASGSVFWRLLWFDRDRYLGLYFR